MEEEEEAIINRLVTRGAVEAAGWLLRLAARGPSPCRAAGSMVAEPLPVASFAYSLFHRANLNDPLTWSAVEELVDAAKLVVEEWLGARLGGYLATGGGSENALTALYAARELLCRSRGDCTILVGAGGHASVEKAAKLLRLRITKAPGDPGVAATGPGGFEEAARRLRRARVAAVVATGGTTETGYVEPLMEAREAAESLGALLYIDASWGWPVLSRELSSLLARGTWVLIGIDYHKHVAPPPSAGLLASHGELLAPLVFEAPYMPLGRQKGLPWTRSAAGAAAAAAALHALGPRGLQALARRLMGLARGLASQLREKGIVVYSGPWTPLVAFQAPRGAEERLRERGWVLYPSPSLPRGLRYVAKWCHTGRDIDEIAEAVTGATALQG